MVAPVPAVYVLPLEHFSGVLKLMLLVLLDPDED
jgi:hypothetical protein